MEQRTDYMARLALLKSGKPRLVVRRAHSNISIQVVTYEPSGDRAVTGVISKELRKLGWKFSCGSLPAAYLSGMLAAVKAMQAGVRAAVLDIGLQAASKGGALFAAAKGAKDAGMDIPLGEDAADMKRFRGEHIAAYAKAIKNTEAYKRQFAACLKAGADPESIAQNFDDVKAKILSQHGAEKRPVKMHA